MKKQPKKKILTCAIYAINGKYYPAIPEHCGNLLKSFDEIPNKLKGGSYTEMGAIEKFLEYKRWLAHSTGYEALLREYQSEMNMENKYELNLNRRKL